MTPIIDLVRFVFLYALFFVYHVLKTFALAFVPSRLRQKFDLKGRRVLITGAGSGLGRALAIEFSKYSTTLILVDINRESLLHTEKLLDRRSPVFIYDCDVSDYKKVYEMAKKVQKDAGDVDILVNNAGIVSGEYFSDLPEEKIIKTMQVNALAHFWTCKAFLPAMVNKNEGHIVNIVSIAGKTVGPRLTDYCASKSAALGFAECLEVELAKKNLDGIKIMVVLPALISTGLFEGFKMKMAKPMTPEYVAKEVLAGILEEKEIIILPHFLKSLLIIKELLPRRLLIKISKITGLDDMMDNFTGRVEKEKDLGIRNLSSKKN